MLILGIETSCDETAITILNSKRKIYIDKIFSQTKLHKSFGGIVPKIASKNHLNILPYLTNNILKELNMNIKKISLITVTVKPGLKRCLLIGLIHAKTIASLINKKYISVDHLEGHILSANINNVGIKYPYLVLLISGGHCEIIFAIEIEKYRIVSYTVDDSIGESFDKIAKILNLGYPGGDIIENYAKYCSGKKIKIKKNSRNFSFSGVKTYFVQKINKLNNFNRKDIFQICAAFQKTITNIINYKIIKSLILFNSKYRISNHIIISGGVASNNYIKRVLYMNIKAIGYKLYFPKKRLCTDNAVMISYTGITKFYRRVYTNVNLNL